MKSRPTLLEMRRIRRKLVEHLATLERKRNPCLPDDGGKKRCDFVFGLSLFFFSVAPFPPHKKKGTMCMSLYVMFFLGLPCLFGFQPAFFAGLVSRCVSCRHVSRREVDHFPTANEAFQAAWVPEVSREGGCCCHT